MKRLTITLNSLIVTLAFLYVPHITFAQSLGMVPDSTSGEIFYTVFADNTYYINSIKPDGSDQNFIAETNNGWFRPSPDGSQILLTQHRSGTIMEGEYDIYLANSDGTHLIRLTEEKHNLAPVWSPSGDVIAFLSGQDDEFDIYTIAELFINTNSLPEHVRLTHFNRFVGIPTWSTDGEKLAFAVCSGNFPCDIYLIKVDGSDLEKLTDDFEDRVDSLTWSPDDQQIAFIAYNEDYQQANIYTLNFETRSFTKLTKTSAEYDFLRWSPNGEQLAFASSASGDWDIYVMDSDGSNLVNLTSNANQDDGFYGLSWSPDGSQIVFSSGPINGNFELFIMDTDGSNLVRLTENELHDTNPIWSAKRDY